MSYQLLRRAGFFISVFLFGILFFSYSTVFSFLSEILESMKIGGHLVYNSYAFSSQSTMALGAANNRDPSPPRGGAEVVIVDDSALLADNSLFRDKGDIDPASNGQISVYIVHQGDTLSQISDMFGVSSNTIRWANDISHGEGVSVGQKLVILPVTGVRHTVKRGDTVESLASKYQADKGEIVEFNDLVGHRLALGEILLIPNGRIKARSISVAGPSSNYNAPSSYVSSDSAGYFIYPAPGTRKTQGIHGYNGIDLGGSAGTSVIASAGGEVVISRDSGWNGGYGQYIVVKHSNGTQTLYGHLSQVLVSAGQSVSQGQVIGAVGNTGRSTGPHLHFEVRGARNPF